MRALLDVNVLIALLDADHAFHQTAWNWFDRNQRSGWASCPITQNGCIRIMSHSAYPNSIAVCAVADRLREATQGALHEFWPDDASLLDATLFDLARVHGPRQLTDTYLLALAARRNGCFVTFDSAVSRQAVIPAVSNHLVVL
jgi:uncharacterized protein